MSRAVNLHEMVKGGDKKIFVERKMKIFNIKRGERV